MSARGARRSSDARSSRAPTSRGNGVFLVFEGLEGAGKSTHAGLLARRLEQMGIPHRLAREPGGTPAGERIRDVVLDAELDLTPETELLLMLAARAEFVRRVVEPALARGEVVIADRYEHSTFAYQGIARGLGLDRVRELNALATGGRRADAVLLLRIDPAESRVRTGKGADRMERQSGEFFRRVAEAYDRLAVEDPAVVVIPAAEEVMQVHERVWSVLETRWPERFPGGQ